MKTRIMLLAAACAALVACNKENAAIDNTSEGTSFKEGQTVTIGVSSGDVSTKVTGTDDGTNINLVWEEGDEILVTVGGASATFTLATGEGTSTATFTGEMPAEGSTFDIQYPVQTPDLSTQTYVDGKISSGMLSFSATGCTLGKTAELTATNSILQLNLYGAARSVNNIVVINNSDSKTYTLTCSEAKVLGKAKTDSTSFYLVVPAGSYNFSVDVSVNALTPSTDNTVSYETYGIGTVFSASTSFSTSAAQTFEAGKVLNMPVKSVTTVFAPVNCGYDATSAPTGLFYQWSRKYGQSNTKSMTDDDFITTQASSIAEGNTEENKDKFYKGKSCWYVGYSISDIWSSEYNPCPTGWRVPTIEEMQSLIGTSTWVEDKDFTGKNSGTCSGRLFPGSGDNQVFLPIAGFRVAFGGTVVSTTRAYYSTSSNYDSQNASTFTFNSGDSGSIMGINKGSGMVVRCV